MSNIILIKYINLIEHLKYKNKKPTRVNLNQHDKPITRVIRLGNPIENKWKKITMLDFQQTNCERKKPKNKINKQKGPEKIKVG